MKNEIYDLNKEFYCDISLRTVSFNSDEDIGIMEGYDINHPNMTKQKFYEEIILKSFEYSFGTVLENEADTLSHMMDWPPKSFSELMIKRAVRGFQTDIPDKQPFDMGFQYLAQVIGFVQRSKDDGLMNDFFEFLEKVKDNKKILDLDDEEHVGILYDSYYESICGDDSYREFAMNMADFILLNCKNNEYHEKVLKLSKAFGLTRKIGLKELVDMERGKSK